MTKKLSVWVTVLCVAVAVILSVLLTSSVWVARMGSILRENPSGAESDEGLLYNETKLREMQEKINTYFIDDVDREELTEEMARAMVKGLGDEWSYYISADEYASYLESVNNAYVGIGVTIRWENEDPQGFSIVDVAPDSPAYRAGIEIGDYMYKVEGELVTELGMDETKSRVRGEEGTSVTLTIVHDGEERELTITRESIKTVNVTYEMLDGKIGYIHIRNFEGECADDTIAAIEDLKAQGVQGIVFDVRFNPGGLKSELVELLDYLLPEGVLFRSVNYDGSEYVDKSDAKYLDLPMAVLVNVDSYSAAEFFAAALQEYGAATVVGTQTYGKGYFQTTHRLSDGSAVHISSGKYFTPNGVSLVGVGITPDKVVEISDEEYADIYYSRMEQEKDVQLQTAIAAVRGN